MKRYIYASDSMGINRRNLRSYISAIEKGVGDITEMLKAYCASMDPDELDLGCDVADMLINSIQQIDDYINGWYGDR